jgi:DNA-binding NarL/FixJ family response regulator
VITVLLVDDQAIVREGLRAMLGLEPDISVVGEAADGAQALQCIAALAPDVVLMDVRMHGMDGLTALEQVKHIAPRVSVIMLTLYDDPDYLLRAVAAGAAGYILKDASREELVQAVRIIKEGGAIITPSMLPQLLRKMSQMMRKSAVPAHEAMEKLSERELEVLRLMVEGKTNQEIAEKLIVSPTTVKTHVQNILIKLDVSDRTQAAVYAVRSGLI